MSAPTLLLRVVSPRYVAGAVFTRTDSGWKCTEAAPILARFLLGRYADEAKREITARRLEYHWLR
jgi:hypothetical protein